MSDALGSALRKLSSSGHPTRMKQQTASEKPDTQLHRRAAQKFDITAAAGQKECDESAPVTVQETPLQRQIEIDTVAANPGEETVAPIVAQTFIEDCGAQAAVQHEAADRSALESCAALPEKTVSYGIEIPSTTRTAPVAVQPSAENRLAQTSESAELPESTQTRPGIPGDRTAGSLSEISQSFVPVRVFHTIREYRLITAVFILALVISAVWNDLQHKPAPLTQQESVDLDELLREFDTADPPAIRNQDALEASESSVQWSSLTTTPATRGEDNGSQTAMNTAANTDAFRLQPVPAGTATAVYPGEAAEERVNSAAVRFTNAPGENDPLP